MTLAAGDAAMTTDHFELVIPGAPVGKARPRFVRATGHTYTPDTTAAREHAIQAAWHAAGSPRLEGAIGVSIHLAFTRPASHYRVNGALSAAGRRRTFPTGKPDWDNAAKLVCDALNGLAWADDAAIVTAHVTKLYDDVARTVIAAAVTPPGGFE